MRYGYGLLRPVVLVALVSLIVFPFLTWASYMDANPHWLLNPMALAGSLIVAGTPLMFNICFFAPIMGLIKRYLSYSALTLAFLFSVPISLWAMSKVQFREPGSSIQPYEFHVAVRKALRSWFHRVLYLVHFGYFPPIDKSLPESGLFVSLLCDLSSGIAHVGLVKYIAEWAYIEDYSKSELFSLSNCVFYILVLVAFVSLVLFDNYVHLILAGGAHKDVESNGEFSEKLISDDAKVTN